MTLQEFRQLKFNDRIELLKEAVRIGNREGGNFSAFLYKLHGFYIEVFHHKKYRYIYAVESFEEVEKLDPYLNKLDLPKLLFPGPK